MDTVSEVTEPLPENPVVSPPVPAPVPANVDIIDLEASDEPDADAAAAKEA